jgi:glycosyltransferase involved in cell wall biosynthesis
MVTGPGVSFVGLAEKKHQLSVLAHYPNIRRQLRRLIAKVDAVIIRLPSNIGSMAVGIARGQNVPVMLEVVGCPYDALRHHGSFFGKALAPLASWQMRKQVAGASHVVYVTKEFLQSRYPTQGKSINCSDVIIYEQDQGILEQRQKRIQTWSSDGAIRLGLMGSLNVNYKGHEVALRSLKRLRAAGHRVSVEFVGPGNPERWERMTEQLDISRYVEFLGLLSRSQVEAWLIDIDIYLQPSKTEGLSRSIIEAMSYGCPVVSCQVGGIPELLDEDFLVKPDDADGLAERIAMLIENPELARAQAARNFKEAGSYRYGVLQPRREAFLQQWLKESLG